MKFHLTILFIVSILFTAPVSAAANEEESQKDYKNRIKQSLVFLDVTAQTYQTPQPWKRSAVRHRSGYGCAVGPYEVLTTAWNINNATFIKAKIASQNEFVPAKVKVIDYESNLCLLSLSPDAVNEKLVPLTFLENFDKGKDVVSYYLTSSGHVKTGRGVLDRAEVKISSHSFGHFLDFVIADAPSSSGRASLYCIDNKPIGIAHWADPDNKETGLIPPAVINQFIKNAKEKVYEGFPSVGFTAKKLIDPATRRFLKMPDDLKNGVYIAKVYTLGTGSKELKQGDCILAIDGNTIDAYGRFQDPTFEKILYHHLVSGHKVGDEIDFVIWRDGKKENIKVTAAPIKASDMLVEYHEYDRQPEYIVTAGLVIQKLTRPYLEIWGDDWDGKCPPHLYHYYRDLAFNPTEERSDIVLLSYVLPAGINQGYHSMGRQVISKINGKTIRSIQDVPDALDSGMISKYITIQFEHDYPTVVIDRTKLQQADNFIAKTYGIQKLKNMGL